MALLDLQGLPESAAHRATDGSQLSLLLCGDSSLSLMSCD